MLSASQILYNCILGVGTYFALGRPAFISPPPSSVTANFGDPVNLTCLAESHPPPQYAWFKDGVLISEETQSFLYISDALPSDRGNYTCFATNTRGASTSASVILTIKGMYVFSDKINSS